MRRLTTAIACAGLAATAGAQPAPPPAFSDYCQALRGYAGGRTDAAVATIDTTPPDALQRMLPLTKSCTGAGASPAIASILLIDVAAHRVVGPPSAVASYLNAGVTLLPMAAAVELRDPTPASLARFQEEWFVTAATLMLAWTEPSRADTLIDRGLRVFKNSARLHALQGAAIEMRTHLNYLNLHDRPMIARAARTPARVDLYRAEAAFRQALALDSTLAAARVHLGRVLFERDAIKEAREALNAAVADTTAADEWRYLAHLFLGAVEEYEHDLVAARGEYEAALAIMPDVQTAYVALTAVLELTGHEDDARARFAEWAQTEPRETGDPWSAYQNGGFDPRSLAALRAQVRP